MNSEFKRPPLRHHHRHVFKQLFSGWPWIIWLSAAIAVVLLLPGGLNRIQFHGVAERTYEYVAPLEDGRLKELLVNMGDSVHAGQLLGELDKACMAANTLMDQASLMKTRDKVFAIQYELEKIKLEEAKTAAELQNLESKWQRTQNLVKKNLLLEQNIEDLGSQIQTVKKTLTLYPALIASLEKRLTAAQTDVEIFNSDNLKQMLKEQRQLKAVTSGIVAERFHQPGDVIEKGEPVLRISNISTSRIIVFMPEKQRTIIAEGEKCQIITTTTRDVYIGTIQTITADIRKLPVFTGFSDQILRGRRIVIELDNSVKLTPGERVVMVPNISIIEQWLGKIR